MRFRAMIWILTLAALPALAEQPLPPAAASISGKVCASPSEGKRVRVDLISPGVLPVTRTTRPDSEGNFRFERLTPDVYQVRAMLEYTSTDGKPRSEQFGGVVTVHVAREQRIAIGCRPK